MKSNGHINNKHEEKIATRIKLKKLIKKIQIQWKKIYK